MGPNLLVSQPLHLHLAYLFSESLVLIRGERRENFGRHKPWEEDARFKCSAPPDQEEFRNAVERYYRMAGFTRCDWSDLGANVYKDEQWILTVTVTVTESHYLFLTVQNLSC